jgi:sRNA-binding regulator protein Hfq
MAKAKTKAPIQTLAEDSYLRKLAAAKTPVAIKMRNGKVVYGAVEIFDAHIVRLAQTGAASLLVYKDEIKYLWEVPSEA